MRIATSSLIKFCSAVLLILSACKQEFMEGVKADPNKTVKVYLPDAAKANGLIPALTASKLVIDTPVNNSANFMVPVYRGGESGTEGFVVDITVDNSNIGALITSGALPANTVTLAANDYSLNVKDSVVYSNNIMKGYIIPKIKIAALKQYKGKVAALGLKLNGTSKHEVNTDMSKVIVYFNVDDLLDVVTPKTNMVDKTKWQPLTIAANTNVTFTVKPDGSILAAGGSGGHAGVYQSFEVSANKKYKIDMKLSGSGAVDTWYEVYVGTVAPTQGADYSNGGNRGGLNTWNGCGKTTFDGMLSTIGCSGTGKGVVTFANSGTVYVVIKSGGSNLGTAGITASNIDFRRFD